MLLCDWTDRRADDVRGFQQQAAERAAIGGLRLREASEQQHQMSQQLFQGDEHLSHLNVQVHTLADMCASQGIKRQQLQQEAEATFAAPITQLRDTTQLLEQRSSKQREVVDHGTQGVMQSLRLYEEGRQHALSSAESEIGHFNLLLVQAKRRLDVVPLQTQAQRTTAELLVLVASVMLASCQAHKAKLADHKKALVEMRASMDPQQIEILARKYGELQLGLSKIQKQQAAMETSISDLQDDSQ